MKSIEIHVNPLKFMKSIEIHGNSWKSIEIHEKPYHMVLLLPIAPLLLVWHNSKVLNRQPATLFLFTQNPCHNANVTCK